MVAQKRAKIAGIPPELTVMEKITDTTTGLTTLRNKHITDSTSSRLLGMNLQGNTLWEAHLFTGKRALVPACRRQLGQLTRLRNCLSFKNTLHLANALILSRIIYGICQWGNTSHSTILKVQTLQNQVARFVTGSSSSTSNKLLMSKCRWLDIEQLTKYHSLLHMFKTVRWQVPQYMTTKLSISQECRITTKEPRLKITSNKYRWKTTSTWNKLPDHLRLETSIARFKTELKTWLHESENQPPDDLNN